MVKAVSPPKKATVTVDDRTRTKNPAATAKALDDMAVPIEPRVRLREWGTFLDSLIAFR